MVSVFVICGIVVATTVAAFCADRLRFLRNRPVLIALIFAVIGIVGNAFAEACKADFGFPVEVRDVPVVIAAMFFNPIVGIVAAIIVSTECVLSPIFGLGTAQMLPGATFLTAAFITFFAFKLTDGKKPNAVQAALAGCYAEMLHTSLDISASLLTESPLDVTFISIMPELIVMSVTGFLCAIACRSTGTLRENLFSSLTLIMMAFATAFTVTTIASLHVAREGTLTMLRQAITTSKETVDAQIGYMLHCNAVSLATTFDWSKPVPIERMKAFANYYDVDELNIIAADGTIISTSDQDVLRDKGSAFSPTNEMLRPFFELTTGKRTFVKQPFRHGINNPNCIAKYIGVPIDSTRFLELGYTWDRFEREFGTFFCPMFSETRFGNGGFCILTDDNGTIVTDVAYHPNLKGKNIREIGIGEKALMHINKEELIPINVLGRRSLCLCYSKVKGWRLFAICPVVEAFGASNILVMVAGLILFSLFIAFRLSELRIRHAQCQIEEFRARELLLAHSVQTSDLPIDFPDTASYRIQAFMRPAREVGGDFYDFFTLADGKVAFVMADVSGKGVPAAIFMMKAKARLTNDIRNHSSLAEAVANANNELTVNNEANMFVTAWVGLFDPRTLTLECVSAGHNPPVLKRADGSIMFLREAKQCAPLGSMPGIRYRSSTLAISHGDTIFTYTDGVTEAMNPKGELFGDARLTKTLMQENDDLIKAVESAVTAHANGAEQSDDITMLVLAVK